MKTVCIECKQYDEWDKDHQDMLLDKYRYINVEHDSWYDGEFEYWATELEKMGYDIVEEKVNKKGNKYKEYQIAFSGFSSQGDGASFTGTVDVKKWVEYIKYPRHKWLIALMDRGLIEGSGTIKRDRWHNYSHWNTTSLYMDWYIDNETNTEHPRIAEWLDQIEADLFKHHQQLNRDIYRGLEECHDADTSDESVAETLRINEYEFDKSGKIM